MMRKILYIVLDGLGDLPCVDLGGKTPLEAAITPHMDHLAKRGQGGFMYPVGEGIAPESDIAVISILGYDPARYYTGRGPLEAHAAGLSVREGDLAHRVNFATLEEGKEIFGRRIIDRRVGRNLTQEEATLLCRAINSKVRLTSSPADFEFLNTVGHRGVLVIRSKEGRLSGRVTNTDPAYGKEGPFGVARKDFKPYFLKCHPEEGFKDVIEAQKAAALTNEFMQKSHEVLEEEEVNKKRKKRGEPVANIILSRDAGDRLPQFPKMHELYKMKWGCFVEMPVEKGIAILTGMEVIQIPLPTGNAGLDYPQRAEMVIGVIDDFDGLYIHLKGPDEPGHDGDASKKKAIIEDIDKFFFGQLLPKLAMEKLIMAITADHSTPCSLKSHSDDPVPVVVSGGDIVADSIPDFSENACAQGSLGKLVGTQLLPILVKLARE